MTSEYDREYSLNGCSIEYNVQSMSEWTNAGAELVIVDPPFGIEFSGTSGNYARDESHVVEGYVEWDSEKYASRIADLLSVIKSNLTRTGQAIIFSGWNNSHVIHSQIRDSSLNLEGKLYWSYNFAPYCRIRPAHNVYELFWVTKDADDWYYTNECSYAHCTDGEANLSHIPVKRDYHKDMPKYPTRLPEELVGVLLEHFSQEGDTVLDPCAGSGMVGVTAAKKGRDAKLSDLNKEAVDVFDELYESVS